MVASDDDVENLKELGVSQRENLIKLSEDFQTKPSLSFWMTLAIIVLININEHAVALFANNYSNFPTIFAIFMLPILRTTQLLRIVIVS